MVASIVWNDRSCTAGIAGGFEINAIQVACSQAVPARLRPHGGAGLSEWAKSMGPAIRDGIRPSVANGTAGPASPETERTDDRCCARA
ncbi:hypothetical protein GCM10008965_55780 [Methylorubrum aminovorans]|nr:hypothetical protein GCM10025880_32310 [Methylorubrum aminovorans]